MAAGLGFKTFATGDVLSAADVNGYLMQGVLVFASAAARNSAITSPQEGQFAFTKDTNGLWYYDGAAWVASGATGDIEGVTAGVGISGGGTSGTVTVTNDMATTITASGDIVVGTGSGTYDNLPIGTTGQILTADTTVSPYKVKWATAAGGFSGVALQGNNPSISAATRTVLAWDTETFDTDGFHSNVTNNSRITIPSGKAGKYYISHGAYWNSGTTRTIVRILKNGTSQRDMQWFGNGTSEFGSIIFAYLDLAVNDYIEIDVYNTSGTLTYNTSGTCGFNAIYLGA
jgi:hypothetical protein